MMLNFHMNSLELCRNLSTTTGLSILVLTRERSRMFCPTHSVNQERATGSVVVETTQLINMLFSSRDTRHILFFTMCTTVDLSHISCFNITCELTHVFFVIKRHVYAQKTKTIQLHNLLIYRTVYKI